MEQEAAAEVCVDLEYCVILNNNNANANEDAGGRLDTADGKNQGKSCVVVMSSRPDDDDDYPLKANDVENNMNTTSSSSSVMVLIDERADDHFIIRGGGGGGGKEKRKKAAKKPPKPPKHRGAEVDDATDHHHQMIIKELAELAMIKRARIERMKALIVQKNSSSSSSSSSGGNQIFAMVFTIFVFLVLLFQGGIMSCQISCGTFTGSPPTQTNDESSFIFIQETLINPSAHDHDHSAV